MRYILGRSGTGKSTKCLNEIKQAIDSAFDKPIIYIVPEQFSFEAEKKLIEISGRNGIIGAQVLSFKRLAYRVFESNNYNLNQITDSGKSMLIYSIMLGLEKDLLVLKGVQNNIGLVDMVADEISEFKRYNLSPDAFEDLNINNEYLMLKIHDLKLIYSAYNEKLSDKYTDSNDELTILANLLKTQDKSLDGAKIWIDEFDGFIPQELNVIKELSKKCDVTISMITGDDEFFELNNANIDRLQRLDNEFSNINSSNFEKAENSIIKLLEPKRFNNEELLQLEQNLYKNEPSIYANSTNHIFLNAYSNSYEETEAVANRILHMIRESEKNGTNLCYENIAVITNDMENYKNLFKMMFKLYNIPFFFDDKKELSKEPLISLVMSFMDIIIKNYDYESMFSYLKTGFTNITDENDIDLVENYVLKWGIKGKTWEEPFTIDDKNLEKINVIREQIVSPLIKFKDKFSGRKTVKEISIEVFNFLNEINVFDRISSMVEQFSNDGNQENIRVAQEYSQVWNTLMAVLDEMVNVIGDEQISFEKFKNTLKVGISGIGLSVIPSTKDKVIIGDSGRTRNSNIKVLFVVGLNDGIFPKTFSSEGFINDQERAILLENNIELAKDSKALLKQEYFNIYKALATPSNELYLSYPTADLEGKQIRPSFILNDIKKVFTNISKASFVIAHTKDASFKNLLNKVRENEDEGIGMDDWNGVEKWFFENDNERYVATLKGLDFQNTIEYQSKDICQKIYGDEINTSVSRLEKYVSCPFFYYLEYGLNLKDRDIYKLGTPDIGSFLHEIIELYSKKVLAEDLDIRTISKEENDSIVDGITDEVIQSFRNNLFSSTGKLRSLVVKLKEQVKKAIWRIVTQIKAGSFEMAGSEVEFGKGKEYPPITIELDGGEKLVLSGKVDRVDVTTIDDKKYIRIIDYKSSNKAIKLSNVYYGIQLQLLAYSDAISGADYNPAGVLYLNLSDAFAKTDKKMSKEEVEEALIKKLRLNGLIISNAKLIEAMDENFDASQNGEAYESDVINLKKSKEGNLSKMPVVTENQFDDLRVHLKKILKTIGESIMSGNICNEPLYKNANTVMACSYCPYSKVCRFDRNLGNSVRRFEELKDDEVLDRIKN